MQIIYEGVDITGSANIASATYTEYAGGRMDELEIAFEQPENWYRWKPQAGDRIELREGNCCTGEMYVQAFCPEEKYVLRAYGGRNAGKSAKWRSFENATLKSIGDECAAECGMECAFYGVDENITYPYLIRKNETALGFLQRLAALEGAVLKCVSGKLNVIGIDYAQGLKTVRSMSLEPAEQGLRYTNLAGKRIERLGIATVEGTAWATDTASGNGRAVELSEQGAADLAQAKRWAAGALKNHNRLCERLDVVTGLDGKLTAMMPVEVYGTDPARGRWLVQEAAHDLINQRTRAVFVRCIDSIE